MIIKNYLFWYFLGYQHKYQHKKSATLALGILAPELVGLSFKNDWLQIHPDGWAEVASRYAWDGCSPAIRLPLVGIWLGTPDGPLMADGRPQTFQASCLHDAFCQFSRDIPLLRDQVSSIFPRMLLEAGFPPWRASLYYHAVQQFGPQDFAANLAPQLGLKAK